MKEKERGPKRWQWIIRPWYLMRYVMLKWSSYVAKVTIIQIMVHIFSFFHFKELLVVTPGVYLMKPMMFSSNTEADVRWTMLANHEVVWKHLHNRLWKESPFTMALSFKVLHFTTRSLHHYFHHFSHSCRIKHLNLWEWRDTATSVVWDVLWRQRTL